MQDFFEASGLTAGLVYRHFHSKDELIATLAGDALEQLHAAVEEAIGAEEPPGTGECAWSGVLRRYGNEPHRSDPDSALGA